jgi:hypothetical protein
MKLRQPLPGARSNEERWIDAQGDLAGGLWGASSHVWSQGLFCSPSHTTCPTTRDHWAAWSLDYRGGATRGATPFGRVAAGNDPAAEKAKEKALATVAELGERFMPTWLPIIHLQLLIKSRKVWRMRFDRGDWIRRLLTSNFINDLYKRHNIF